MRSWTTVYFVIAISFLCLVYRSHAQQRVVQVSLMWLNAAGVDMSSGIFVSGMCIRLVSNTVDFVLFQFENNQYIYQPFLISNVRFSPTITNDTARQGVRVNTRASFRPEAAGYPLDSQNLEISIEPLVGYSTDQMVYQCAPQESQ